MIRILILFNLFYVVACSILYVSNVTDRWHELNSIVDFILTNLFGAKNYFCPTDGQGLLFLK